MSEKLPPYPTPPTHYTSPADYKITSQPGSIPPPPPLTGATMIRTTATGGQTFVAVQPKRIFSKYPTSLVCPYCGVSIVTKPRAEVGITTWISALLLIFLGCWLGCCFIPFFIDECKDIYHDCPKCQRTIEIYKPL